MSNAYYRLPLPDLSGLAPRANPTFTGTAGFASLNVLGAASFDNGLTVGAFPSIIGSSQMDSGTALAFSPTNAVVRVRLTGNATLTLPASPTLATNARTMLEVELVQDGTGGRTVTWAAASGDTIEWDYSTTAPAIATAAGKETHFIFRRRAGSTTWYAAKIWQGI
jgi:hypothetical protein